MLSEYVLLCAPYRFSEIFFNKPSKNIIEKELFSVIMPGVNIATRFLVRLGIKNNFGIVDKKTLINETEALYRGDYQAITDIKDFINQIEDEEEKDILFKLNTMAKEKSIKGFDDCRIIDVITKAYAGKLIKEEEFKTLFKQHTERIKSDYESWEQYLASCVLGKLAQVCYDSYTVKTKEEYIRDIYFYCIAPINVFSYSTFWKNYDLENLGLILSELLDFDYKKDKADILASQEK